MTIIEKYDDFQNKFNLAVNEAEKHSIGNEWNKWEESLTIKELEELINQLREIELPCLRSKLSLRDYNYTKCRLQRIIEKKKKELELNKRDTTKVIYSK